jgi:hypothetical protein
VAADEVVRRHPDVAYFPAYEIVLGPHNRESPFETDLRTVREPIIAAVMRAFRAALIDEIPATLDDAGTAPAERFDELVAAALSDDCDEMMADERLWVPLSG